MVAGSSMPSSDVVNEVHSGFCPISSVFRYDTRYFGIWPDQPPFSLISSVNRANRWFASCGPGDASGWYCTEKTGCSR